MQEELVPIYIMGKQYKVPRALTIMKAMEYSGYRFIRGSGCRDGMCGACATVYRTTDDYKLKVALACQTVIEPGMYLTQIPFFPANKAIYNLKDLKPVVENILKLYPEITRCVSCNTCTRACPQSLEVMHYVQAALRGDIKRVAELSFECIMCGLCAARCPAEITQYYIGLLCRRLYGRSMPKASHLQNRIKEIMEGKFDEELLKIKKMSKDELVSAYKKRELEPE